MGKLYDKASNLALEALTIHRNSIIEKERLEIQSFEKALNEAWSKIHDFMFSEDPMSKIKKSCNIDDDFEVIINIKNGIVYFATQLSPYYLASLNEEEGGYVADETACSKVWNAINNHLSQTFRKFRTLHENNGFSIEIQRTHSLQCLLVVSLSA